MCELLGEDALLRYFPVSLERCCARAHIVAHAHRVPLCHTQLLKSSEKLYAQDQIWKKICKELRWEFIASV